MLILLTARAPINLNMYINTYYNNLITVLTYKVTNITRVVVCPGSVFTPSTKREDVEKAKSVQFMPSLQLYLHSTDMCI